MAVWSNSGCVCGIFYCLTVLFMCVSETSGTSAETELYNHLLTNYSHYIRPSQTGLTQTVVNISIGLSQIEALNEKDQILITHGYMQLFWWDELLVWNPSQWGGLIQLIVQADQVWLPEITPINSVFGATELAGQLGEDTRVKIFSNGMVFWIPAMKWQTSCDIDVSKFPYDSQSCELRFANWMYTASLLNYTAVSDIVDLSGFSQNQEWTITETSVHTEMLGESPILSIRLSMKRDPTFFELNVLLPAMLLSFLMIPMFVLPAESGEKVSLGVTLMLAYSIFLLMMTDVTPKSGTTPQLTVVILVSTMFSGLSILLNVIVINVHHHTPQKRVPKWVRKIFLVKLAKILCCMKYVDENEVEPIRLNNAGGDIAHITTEKGHAKLKLGDDFTNDGALNKLLEYYSFMKERKMEKDEMAANQDEWTNLARVLDRLLMWTYVVYFLANSIAVLSLKLSA